jgi:hypothetical protein
MIRDRALQTREKLVDKLPVTGELLRGSLLEAHRSSQERLPEVRTRRRASGVRADGELCGRTRAPVQRAARVAEVRRWLDNYQKLKDAIEAICELNHPLLRPDAAVPRGGRKKRD